MPQGNLPPNMQAANMREGPAVPGTVNYIEGQAAINGQPVNPNAIGSLALQPGQTFATRNGRAEILLTPGVFVRLGANSMATMISPDPANPEVRLDRGRALVEVDGILKANSIRIVAAGRVVQLQTKGLYDFDADSRQLRVFDGRAAVLAPDREIHVQGGHEVSMMDPRLKARDFDKRAYEDEMYRWSSLRSSYLAQANIEMARAYYGGNGWAPSPWVGPNWYWDPWYSAYTWLPGDGIFWNPWGFGFYSPLFVFRAPFIGFGGGFHNFGPGFRPSAAMVRVAAANGFSGAHAGAGASGFARSGGGMSGGGFHGGGGGGGFHGGGGGGGHR